MADRPINKYRNKDNTGNTLREEPAGEAPESAPAPEKEKKTDKKPVSKPAKPLVDIKAIREFVTDPTVVRITGWILVFISISLLVSFVSFLFTWENDQDKVAGPTGELLNTPDIRVDNWMGKTGAIMSYLFIHRGFGVSSFFIVFVLGLVGLRNILQTQILPLAKSIRLSFFGLVWLSVTLGYFFNGDFAFLGGIIGFECNQWLQGMLGGVGTGFLLGVTLIIFLLLQNIDPLSFLNKKNSEPPQAAPQEEDDKNELINSWKEEIRPDEEEEMIPADEIPEPVLLKKPEVVVSPEEIVAPVVTVSESPAEQVSGSIELNITPSKTPEKKSGEPVFEVEAPAPAEEISSEAGEVTESAVVAEAEALGAYDPTLDLGHYQFPTLDLLEAHGSEIIDVNNAELDQNKTRIIDTLKNYGIDIEKIKATIGPTVTLYEIVPAAGVRISKIKNLEDDIALSLSALGIRIIAPIPGKGTIGIEVPNQKPQVVSMKSVLASDKFQNSGMDLPVALGKTISNEVFVADLAKMPHLLMAGATGQGKSVGLNAILVSLLYKKHPSQLKLVLVDPKKVELTLFKAIEKHFLAKLEDSESAIITDTKKVINTLNSLCFEMDTRYKLLENATVRTIKEYNEKFINRRLNPEKGHKYLPFIVVVVDEFADFIMTAGKEVETPIARLAQLARAVGIHLIIATQRPAANIITGNIKANFPARAAFRVASKIDSRTILDSGGADQLIGRGDMLFSTGNDLLRVQCAFVDTPEVARIAEFIGNQQGYSSAFILPPAPSTEGSGDGGHEDMDPSQRDSMFTEAAKIVVGFQQGSTSFIQRRLQLGYNRAGRIMDQLESAGIVGPNLGSKPREVLIKDELTLEQKLKDMGL